MLFIAAQRFRHKVSLSIFLLTLIFSTINIEELVAENKIYIVAAGSSKEYLRAIEGIENRFKERSTHIGVDVIFLKEEELEDEGFWRKIEINEPVTIIAVGTKASDYAIKNVETIPIISTMTWEYPEQEGESQSNNLAGSVLINVPIERQLELLLNALPLVRRLGFICSPQNYDLLQSAENYLSGAKVEVASVSINNYKEVASALREILPAIDALIIPPDANVYRSEVLNYLFRECFRSGVPIMAFSKNLAVAGAPLAIGLDYEDIGRQTAELALNILTGNETMSNRQFPRKVFLYINEGVSSKLGLYYSRRVLNNAVFVGEGNSKK